MSIEFRSNDLLDITIFSGVEFNCEKQVPRSLTGPAAQSALQQIQASYHTYKDNLNLNYDRFLKIVEANLGKLNKSDMPSPVRASVASKLEELAGRRITQEESHFSCIYTFFHKLGQLLQRHGFRTKGEWGLELVSRMRKVESEIYKPCLSQAIFHGAGLGINETPPAQVIVGMMDQINGLSEEQFKEILSDIIFKKKETDYFGNKNKLVFYKALNDEKKGIFERELLARVDWYAQAFDIIEGADDEEFAPFVIPEMVRQFQENPSQVMTLYKNKKNHNGWHKRFFYTLIEATIKDYLAANSVEGYLKIENLLNGNRQYIEIGEIMNNPKILTAEEIQNIRNNIKI